MINDLDLGFFTVVCVNRFVVPMAHQSRSSLTNLQRLNAAELAGYRYRRPDLHLPLHHNRPEMRRSVYCKSS